MCGCARRAKKMGQGSRDETSAGGLGGGGGRKKIVPVLNSKRDERGFSLKALSLKQCDRVNLSLPLSYKSGHRWLQRLRQWWSRIGRAAPNDRAATPTAKSGGFSSSVTLHDHLPGGNSGNLLGSWRPTYESQDLSHRSSYRSNAEPRAAGAVGGEKRRR